MPNGREPADKVGLSEGVLSPQQSSPAAVLMRAIALALAWHERTRQRRCLMQLDDHGLDDIGVGRADAERESRNPFWRPFWPPAMDL